MKQVVLFAIFQLIACLTYSQSEDSVNVVSDTVISRNQEEREVESPLRVRKDTRPLTQRISLGFGSAFWINVNYTHLELAPVVAYRFPKRLITGAGYRYIYRIQRVSGQDLISYGPNVFARFNLLKRLYFWTEYEILKSEYIDQISGQPDVKTISTTNSWFAGLGYIQSVGKRGRSVSVQLLYNVLYNNESNSPYYSPITYRVGYYF